MESLDGRAIFVTRGGGFTESKLVETFAGKGSDSVRIPGDEQNRFERRQDSGEQVIATESVEP